MRAIEGNYKKGRRGNSSLDLSLAFNCLTMFLGTFSLIKSSSFSEQITQNIR